MTLLQMTGMYQAIANDGVRIPPRIVKATIAPDGTRTEEPRPEGVRVVSPQTAQTVRNMLRAVVQRDPMGIQQGTGPRGRGRGLPDRRQDRHRPADQPGLRLLLQRRLLDHLRRHGPRRRPALRGRHHDGQPAPHRRRLARVTRRRRCSTTSPRWLLQRENVPLSPDPGPPLTLQADLTARRRRRYGRARYCVMAMKLRPMRIPSAHRARRRWPTQVRRVSAPADVAVPDVRVTGVTLRGQDAPARRPVRRAARRRVARRPLRRRRGRAAARSRCSPTPPARPQLGADPAVPVLVHPDPRVGARRRSPPTVYGHPSRAAARHRRHRHLGQDHHHLPGRGRAAGGRAGRRADRHRRHPDRRRATSPAR